MRIRGLETFPVALPFRQPYVTATGTLESREMVLVRIVADDGEGWGDAVPLSLRGGAALADVRADLDGPCAAALTEDDRSREEHLDACAAAGVEPPALAAVDAALLDLEGRLTGNPAWWILGLRERVVFPCNGTLGGGEPGDVAASAQEMSHFDALKVKVGTGDDRERLRAVREAVGPRVKLRIDANSAWGVEQAAEEIAAIHAEVGLELAEQPCATLAELAEVRRLVSVPIVADESIASVADAERAVAEGACDAATLKLAKVGGIREAIRIAGVVPAYMSSALDSPLGIKAAAAVVQALPGEGFVAGLAQGLATTSLFADNVAPDGDLRHKAIALTASPGLGVEIDRDAVERLAIR